MNGRELRADGIDDRHALRLLRCRGYVGHWPPCEQRIIDRRRIAVRRHLLVVDKGKLLARLLGLALAIPHAGVEPVLQEELMVGAALCDHALVEHNYFVGADRRRESMRDDERGAPA